MKKMAQIKLKESNLQSYSIVIKPSIESHINKKQLLNSVKNC